MDPFAQQQPTAEPRPTTPVVEPERPVDQPTVDTLVAAIKNSEHRALINGWVAEGGAAGRPWNPRSTHLVADFERARAALRLADAASGDPECTRLIIGHATQLVTDEGPIGELIGLLTVAECAAVIAVAEAFGTTLGLRYSADGRPHLEGDVDAVLAGVQPLAA